jgi:hypothetical protein
VKKREIEIAERAIARIALEYHTTVEEVRLQIKVAMLNGLASDDPKIKAYWKSIPHEGDVPTPEELIAFTSKILKKRGSYGIAVERRRRKAIRAFPFGEADSCNKCVTLRNRRAFLYKYEVNVMDYISIAEAAEKWGITRRRVQVLCNTNRIPGLTKFGKAWAIPKDAEKPADARKERSNNK